MVPGVLALSARATFLSHLESLSKQRHLDSRSSSGGSRVKKWWPAPSAPLESDELERIRAAGGERQLQDDWFGELYGEDYECSELYEQKRENDLSELVL